jgi:DcaP outer membrane protein
MKMIRTRRQMIGIAGAWAVLALGVVPANARAQSAAAGSEATATQPPTTTTTTTQKQPPPTTTTATTTTTGSPTLEIYGFGQADAIVDFRRNNPDWYDVNRPSRLPSFPGEFGDNGHFYLSPRQSRFGAKGVLPTSEGDVTATFDFDMFGVGRDAGLTTIRLRNAWGQWKQVGGGLRDSQFMDGDVFPNILEYWGPDGMLFYRNTQVFWEPFNDGMSNARVAIENPGASGDAGLLSDRIELQNVRGRFPMPDITGHYRWGRPWGYLQLGGALRYIAWDDLLPSDPFDLAGHVWGWGVSVSSNVNATENDVLRLQVIWGRGVENYFNDAPVDVGIKRNPGNLRTPVTGEALKDFGMSAYLDHRWNSEWTSAIGYSRVDITNSDLQTPLAFKVGQYASGNLLCTPVKNVLIGGEFQWGKRENFSDGFSFNDYRVQFSLKYNFSYKIGG